MPQTLVLGAGMVGVGAALALQARGHDVVLLDRRAPGEETSYGNAGIIQTEQAEPVAMPRAPGEIWRIALGRGNDVVWHARALPAFLRPLLGYYRNSAPARLGALAGTWAPLTRRAADDHKPLIAAAGAEALIREGGFRIAFRDGRAFAQAARAAEALRRAYDVPSTVLDTAALAAAEPGLRAPMAGALHYTGPLTCRSPGGLVKAYAALFESRGGTIVSGDASGLIQKGAGWACQSASGPSAAGLIEAETVVVALGPWSADLVARFGYRVPLFRKRGYHLHLAPGSGPRLPFLDADNGALLSEMEAGVRITTGAELTGPEAPVFRRQIDRAVIAARALFDLGAAVEPEPWFGARPCLPDMLPLVGPAPRHRGLWFDFGHAHQGFTLGPTTGILLAAMMAGEAAPGALGYRWR